MRLTSFTDDRLRMRMASAHERAFSTADLAEEFGLSRNHLLETRRGGGGAVLAHPASDIRFGAVVCLLEEGQPLVECLSPEGGTCMLDDQFRLKRRLRASEAAFTADLDRATLADIAFEPLENV